MPMCMRQMESRLSAAGFIAAIFNVCFHTGVHLMILLLLVAENGSTGG